MHVHKGCSPDANISSTPRQCGTWHGKYTADRPCKNYPRAVNVTDGSLITPAATQDQFGVMSLGTLKA